MLWPTAHRFQQGHRLRLLLANAAHPRYARNLGHGDPVATSTRMRPATTTALHTDSRPSRLVLPILDSLKT
jgi:predicted acyl esterase